MEHASPFLPAVVAANFSLYYISAFNLLNLWCSWGGEKKRKKEKDSLTSNTRALCGLLKQFRNFNVIYFSCLFSIIHNTSVDIIQEVNNS